VSEVRALAVRGPFRGGTGYDYHTRSFVRELVRLGVRVQLEELAQWSRPLPPHLQDPFFERLTAAVDSSILLQFVMPHQVVVRPGLRSVNYTMFETTRIPPHWAAHAQRCALTVVPTRSGRDAWTASGVPADRVAIVPLGVRAGLAAAGVAPLPLQDARGRPVSAYRHRFLSVAELIPRKNLLGLIETWMRTTTPHDDAVLILKTNAFRPQLGELFAADLAALMRRLGKTPADCAPICCVTEYLPDAQMPSLYETATHYVSMSCGEGWDLPMTEAAAAGLALIAPRHSAYLDYLDDDCAYFIPAEEGPVDTHAGALARVDAELFEGMRWWVPDGDAARAILRAILDGRAPPRSSPQQRIARDFSWEAVSRRLLTVLGELRPRG
jgi:glycosyltransferase involved in cell wall biosynthesis